MPFTDLSPKLQDAITASIAEREKFHKDNNGNMIPFAFCLEGTGAKIQGIKQDKKRQQDAILPDQIKIWDPYDKARSEKSLRNVVSASSHYDHDKGKTVLDEKLEPIEFVNGWCYVGKDDLNKIAILRYAHNNISKPASLVKSGVPIQSIRWEERKEHMYSRVLSNDTNEAKMLLMALQDANKTSFERKQHVLTKLSETAKYKMLDPTGKYNDVIENDFYAYVKNNPKEYLHMHVEDDVKVKVKIADLKHRGLLIHDEAKGKWVIGENKRKFHEYPKATTQDPEAELVKAILADKSEKSKMSLMDWYLRDQVHPYLPRESTEKEEKVEEELLVLP